MTRGRGFTLIELVVILAVAVVLLTLAVPGFQALIQNNRLATQANEFITALNLARSEAIKRGIRVTVCKSINQTACTAGGDWRQGWIVFTDQDNDAAKDPNELILHAHDALSSGNTLTGNSTVDDYISYNASGFSQLSSASGGFQAGSLRLCDARGNTSSRIIVINRLGRVRVSINTGVTASTPACL